MRKLSTQDLAAAMIFAFMFSMSVQELSAQAVTERMMGGGGGITGTFDCSCVGQKGGSCQVSQTPTGITCSNGNGTCDGTCTLHTTTTGIFAPAIAAEAGGSSQPKSNLGAPNMPARQ